MLTVCKAGLSLGNKTLIADIEADFAGGEVVAILGANGAGKSSLLSLLSGERAPTAGQVFLHNKALDSWSGRELSRMRAVMPQQVQLAFPFSVREVVEMGLVPSGRRGRRLKGHGDIVDQVLEWFDVDGLCHRLYPTLSGGEQQRVQLARVICQIMAEPGGDYPRYLMLDECTSALDPAHQHQVFDVIEGLTAHGVGVIAIMHDLNLAARYADRILLLHQGRVLAQGSPTQVLDAPTLAQAYQLDALILEHPEGDYPLVVNRGRLQAASAPIGDRRHDANPFVLRDNTRFVPHY